jgi:hypothetical protein
MLTLRTIGLDALRFLDSMTSISQAQTSLSQAGPKVSALIIAPMRYRLLYPLSRLYWTLRPLLKGRRARLTRA